MKTLKACIVKDVRLFLSGRGLASLIFPVLLVALLMLGFSDAVLGTASVRPFNVAVRDSDDTPMSRVAIKQLSDITLLDTVIDAGTESDESLFAAGAAAVLTIPKDFFYSIYRMEKNPVRLVLNGDMPLEAELFNGMISSVMGIIVASQQANKALFDLKYGELSDFEREQLYEQAAMDALIDATSRQRFFTLSPVLDDTEKIVRSLLCAFVLSLICMLIPISVLKTMADEINLGILQRFRSAGGRVGALFASKAVSALLLSAIPAVAVIIIANPASGVLVPFVVVVLALGASLGMFFLIAALLEQNAFYPLLCSLIILLSLVVGGVVYPLELLPKAVQGLAVTTIPYYVGLGMKLEPADMYLLWPLAAMAVLFTLAGVFALNGRRRIW